MSDYTLIKIVAAVVFLTLVTSLPAHAGENENCVTAKEYAQIEPGMTRREVHAIFGTRGIKGWQQWGKQDRAYKGCEDGVIVTVVYTHKGGRWIVERSWMGPYSGEISGLQ